MTGRALLAVAAETGPSASETRLLPAVRTGVLDSVALALDLGADPNEHGGAALLLASGMGRADIVALLLDRGANPNVKDEHGNTPLFVAAGNCGGAAPRMVQALLGHGADVNARCISDATPLQSACETGRPFVVGLLLASGADVNATEKSNGDTALHIAAYRAGQEATRANLQAIDLLLGYGADVNARDADRKTPLDLLKAGATHRFIVDPTISLEIRDDLLAHRAIEPPATMPSGRR